MMTSFAYPFIFSLFPVLSLYLKNIGEVRFSEVLFTCIFLLFLTACVYMGSLTVSRKSQKASLLTFIIIFFIFSFEAVFSPFERTMALGNLIDFYPKFFIFWLILFSFLVTLVFLAESYIELINKFLSFFSVFLVLFSLTRIVVARPWLSTKALSEFSETSNVVLDGNENINKKLPDIYYIILDRYLGEDVLMQKYGFDNSEFINFLRSKGFYVAEKSRSNYLKTAYSLASSLNMEYINYLSEEFSEDSSSWLPLYSLMENNKVVNTLKKAGYKYIFIGSWWEPTRKSDIADVNINLNFMSEFSENLLGTTFFSAVKGDLLASETRKEQFQRSMYEIDYLKKVSQDKALTYTFAHFLITHPPYIFNESGGLLSNSEIRSMGENEIYLVQIKNVNKLFEELINNILASSEVRPVIIIQSDEGKYPVDSMQYDHKYDWFKATKEDIGEKVSILNAIYIPDIDESVFYPAITPVNTFRIVFNELFNTNTNMGLLPDETYLNRNNINLYEFKKID